MKIHTTVFHKACRERQLAHRRALVRRVQGGPRTHNLAHTPIQVYERASNLRLVAKGRTCATLHIELVHPPSVMKERC